VEIFGREGDGWLSWYSTSACYGSSLGSNLDIFQKYKMGDISEGVAKKKQILKKILGDKMSRG
jgi:hypothetical protein